MRSDYDDLVHLDRAFAAQEKSGFLPVSFSRIDKKTGEIVLKGAERALTEGDWSNWLSYTEALLRQAVAEIKDGYIAPRPFVSGNHSQCDFCDGAQSCPNAGRYGARRHDRKVKKESITQMMQEEAE